jgi:PLAT/LH2 domain
MRRPFLHLFITTILILSMTACTLLQGSQEESITKSEEAASTAVKITLMTGSDGTADNPIFGLFDNTGTTIFTTTLDNPGDLQPGQTDIYEFSAPYSFCEFIGWQLTKPATGGSDDGWQATSIRIELNGETTWLDGAFADLGTITAESQRGGNWSGIEAYTTECID